MAFVQANKRKLNYAIKPERNDLFDYYGIRTVYDRYLLKHPQKRTVLETPQYFFMRVSCGLAETGRLLSQRIAWRDCNQSHDKPPGLSANG